MKTRHNTTREPFIAPPGFGVRQSSGAFGSAHKKRQRTAALQGAGALLIVLGLVLFGAALDASAASPTPPERMSYQGFLVDVNGAALAPSSPANYPVVFRIYDASTGGNILWSEQQIVTVDKGNFSVVLGEGTSVSGEARPDLSSVFAGPTASDRYIGIAVTISGTTMTISPRLRWLPSPYAFAASKAVSLVNSSGANLITTSSDNVGIGTTSPRAKLEVDGNVILRGAAGGNSWSNQRLLWGGDGTGYALSFGSINNAGTINTPVLTMLDNGNVGIGTTSPRAKLEVDGNVILRGAAGGNSWSNQRLLWGGDGTGYALSFGSINNAGTINTPVLTMLDNANVGIGTTSPGAKLDVQGGLLRVHGSDATSTIEFKRTSDNWHPATIHQSYAGNFGANFEFRLHPNDGVQGTLPVTRLYVQHDGNVGIGTSAPEASLTVFKNLSATTWENMFIPLRSQLILADAGQRLYLGALHEQGIGSAGMIQSSSFYTITADPATDHPDSLLLNPKGGSVGIGTTSPTQAKLVVNGVAGADAFGNHGYFVNTGTVGLSTGNFNLGDVSIKASHAIHAEFFRAVSDARIKSIQGRSNGAADLETLNRIEITDYQYKDAASKGNRPHKKVVGQQVEQVFPQAVVHSVDVVPDIYKEAPVQGGWINLATTLKKGERVRLVSDTQDGLHEVLEVTPDKFRTALESKDKSVFVYGREVKDFRVVDYEAIAMLNVSATQELAKKVEALRKSEARIAELEQKAARVDSLERKVEELTKLVAGFAQDQTPRRVAARNAPDTGGE